MFTLGFQKETHAVGNEDYKIVTNNNQKLVLETEQDGEKWLVSCSHEQESFINTNDKNEIKRVFDIVGLKAHIGEL